MAYSAVWSSTAVVEVVHISSDMPLLFEWMFNLLGVKRVQYGLSTVNVVM